MSDKTITNDTSTNTINYNNAVILHDIKADKYTSEIREYFVIECPETKEKFKLKKESVLTLAELNRTNESFNLLINNGWGETEKMKAGAGLALKMTRLPDAYNCIFYGGELGKPFEVNKIARRSYLKLDKTHLEAIFTFLLKNEEVLRVKNEELKRLKTTLNLG